VTRTSRLVLWTGFVGLLVALAYAGRAESGKPDPNVLYQYGTAVSGLVSYLIMLAIVLAIAGGSAELLALSRPRSWPAALGFALAVFAGILIVNGALNPFLHAGEEQGLTPTGWDASRAGQYAANFAIVAVLGPIVEELTYRGLGVSLWHRFGRWVAIVVTALLFGLSHGLVDGLPILTVFGAGLAWLRLRTDSVYPGMVVHGCFNALALIVAVAT
jgi:membrane protease YdiL (CAAX protease family)